MERIQEVFEGENFMNCALCKYRSNLLGFESEDGIVLARPESIIKNWLKLL